MATSYEASGDTKLPFSIRLARTLFFVINFLLGALLFASCVVWIIEWFFGGHPTLFLGGLALIIPTFMFTITEWLAFYRRRRQIERILAVVMLGLSGFTVFGVAVNVGEAIYHGGQIPDGFEWFIVIGLGMAVYFLMCGACRLWSTRGYR